jgi:hypothetical protein
VLFKSSGTPPSGSNVVFFIIDLPKAHLMPVYVSVSRDSVVGIATRYGLKGPGIESRWDEIFRTFPDRSRGPPSLLYNGYRAFPRGKGGRDVMLTTHPLLAPRLRKSWAIPPLTLWVLLGVLWGSLYLYTFLSTGTPKKREAESFGGVKQHISFFFFGDGKTFHEEYEDFRYCVSCCSGCLRNHSSGTELCSE